MPPNPATRFPLPDYERLCFLKNLLEGDRIEVGDYTYYDDFEDVNNFLKNVRYHFDFTGDRLLIGKFCQIASGVRFIMNGGNHLADSFSTYPFAIFGGDWAGAMDGKSYPNKGDTHIGNDVWIGYNALLMPGVTIGDGAVIGTNATVVKDVAPYTIVGGNPAQPIRRRFSDAVTEQLLQLRWWDRSPTVITQLLPLLTGADEAVLKETLLQLNREEL